MAEYNVSESTAKSYLSVVTRLGALESRRNGALTITAFGEKVLMAEPGDKARIVTERFMRDYLAFPEVLAVYDDRTRPSISAKWSRHPNRVSPAGPPNP